jgi:hypothetical protein
MLTFQTKKLFMKRYLIFFAAFALIGCKKFLNVNKDPNTATVTKANYVFTNALNTSAGGVVYYGHELGSTWAGFWAHSNSFTGGGQEKTYVFTNNDFAYFESFYENLTDYKYVIDHAAADGFPHLVGPAKVMQCLMFQKLVDLYGNVPYTAALQGTVNKYPSYDDAKTIYESLITKLTDAIKDIKAATWPLSEASDIVFKGNKTSWLRFANTLKMRILIRQSNMPGRDSYITGAINTILAEGSGFLNDNVYCNPGYSKSAGKLNPFYGAYGYDQNDAPTGNYAYRKMNAVIIDWLKNSNDLFRLQRLARPISGGDINIPGDYTGVPMGAAAGYLEAVCSSIGPIQIEKGDATRPAIIMTAAESYFLLSEAAQRYGITGLGTALSNYTNGVNRAFRLAAATHTGTATATDAEADAEASAYLSAGTQYADWSLAITSADKLRTIQIQKWVSLCNIDGLEAWSEYRRTNSATSTGCCPVSPHTIAIPFSSPEPVRLYYPLSEESVNGSNVPQGINVFTGRIFWDVN